MNLCVNIVRVHLNRQIFPGIDELHQNGKARFSGVAGAQIFRVSQQNFRQAQAVKGAARRKA